MVGGETIIFKQYRSPRSSFKSYSFKSNVNYLIKKATCAMYEVLKKGRLHILNISCQLDLFDKLVKPILLYGSEIWGTYKTAITEIEKVHLKFCKLILKLKRSTPNYMINGELGRHPLSIDIKMRMVTYWAKLLLGKDSKIYNTMYALLYKLNANENKTFK